MKNLEKYGDNNIDNFEKFNEVKSVGRQRREQLSGRSKVIEMTNVEEVLEKYASWYDVNCKTPLFRGLKSNDIHRKD